MRCNHILNKQFRGALVLNIYFGYIKVYVLHSTLYQCKIVKIMVSSARVNLLKPNILWIFLYLVPSVVVLLMLERDDKT